jgi:hypothetical protein
MLEPRSLSFRRAWKIVTFREHAFDVSNRIDVFRVISVFEEVRRGQNECVADEQAEVDGNLSAHVIELHPA